MTSGVANGLPGNPFLDQSSLSLGDGQAGVGWRHPFGRVLGTHPLIDAAGRRLARNEHAVVGPLGEQAFAGVKPHLGLPFGFVRAVAVVAEVGEDRTDVAVEIDRLGERRFGSCEGRAK